MNSKLIIVSNRLPFKIEKRNGQLEIRKSTGGLASSMASAIKTAQGCVWVGAADFSRELWDEYQNEQARTEISIRPIFLEKKIEKRYYHGFSNSIIWPLFHYFPSFAVYKEEFYSAYVEANAIFCDHIAQIIEPNDIVWIHDYHLMLLPGLLKQKFNTIGIGFFLHIPFPSYEILKHIPETWRNNLLTSLLKADVIGFHTKEYVSHFQRTLSYFLGVEVSNQTTLYEQNTVLIKEYPISIDYARFSGAFDEKPVAKGRSQIKKRHHDVKLIFSVDRLDYTKGVLNRLQAFEEMLSTNTDLRQKVTFIINVVPSRDKHKKYAERRKLIEEQIGHINGLYGNVHWTPIIYQYSHLSFHQLLSFYTACDVALVTPLRDGMNLVAKEFVASRKDKRGTLVLSEFAGAANELTSAILVNPNDLNLMKTAMLQALNQSPEEQQTSMTAMQQTLRINDVEKWTRDFLGDLTVNRNMNKRLRVRVMNFDERLELLEQFKKANRRLILLDYDGTLVPYYDDPAQARPDKRTIELLLALTSNKLNRVVIISGRATQTLEQWFEDLPVDLVAEHGGYHRAKGSPTWSFADFESESWKPGVKKIFEEYAKQHEGSFVEEKNHAVTWHYRKAVIKNEETLVQNICRDLTIHNATNQFNVLCGNKIIEAKNVKFDKGTFVEDFLKANDFDFVLAIGDDATDEDMFCRLNESHHFTIRVGLKSTNALYNLIGVSNVYSFLEQLCAFRRNTARVTS
jgi:trehalose 6-phosphate synthase/phosphatase